METEKVKRYFNRMGRQGKKIAAVFGCLALAFCLVHAFGSHAAYAKEKRTVRVAFFPMDGYHVKEADGSFAGMDAEYLDALCEYANWNIAYVECKSWDEALELLADKKVDLVGSAQYSTERAKIYQYADLSSGYTFGIIATNAGSTLAYEDFEAMKGITFGMVKTYVRRNEFLQYLSDNGVEAPRIREYASTAQLQEALDKGEIDALVHTFMEVKEGQRLIGRFAPRPFYYITYPGNEDVIRELDQAVADLKMNRPELETKLMNEFYQSKLDKTVVFTTEEKNYIADAGRVTVGYLDGHYPFSYEEDESCKGLTRELLEGVAGVAGLRLSWQKVESPKAAREALQDGTIDILSYSTDTKEELDEYQLVKMEDYVQIPLVLVMKKGMEPIYAESLATVPYLSDEAGAAVDLSVTSLQVYDTQQECLEAVRSKKADAVLCDGYLAEYLLSAELRYHNLEVKSVLQGEHSISMAVRDGDAQLAGILRKTLLTIDARAVNDYMLERNVYSLLSISQLLKNNSDLVIMFLLLLMVVIVLVAWKIIKGTKKIQKLMYKDVELDIWNLNYLVYYGEKTLLPERKGRQYAVAYINIAQFGRYNVIHGWSSAQKLLESIALALSRSVRNPEEICAKAHGDHFVLLLSVEQERMVERLKTIEGFLEEFVFRDTGNHIAIQMGAYCVPKSSNDLRGAVACANQALDFVQAESGENIKVYDAAMEKAIKERHEKEELLESVDIDQDFATYYQAKVDIRTEEVVGAEALVRFLDPTASGAVRSPGFFVPYYEQTGRVTEIDFFVLQCVCRMLRRRMDQGQDVVTVSCNFSRMHFMKPGFAERFERVLSEYRVPKELVEVEITETLIMEEMEQKIAEQTLAELWRRGVRLSIDDFGSGYSSLGVIEKIPASIIKLDRSFLLNREDRKRQVKIMKRIVDLAHDLDAHIVCEGVETDEDVELMKEIGAHVAQGYRYAKPVPEEEFEDRLNAQSEARK